MGTPNFFFSDAPESLQDAFIRWLVECATESTNPLHECGLAFVSELFRAGASAGTQDIPVLNHDGNPMDPPYNGPCNVTYVGNPCTQYNRIDVYFQAKVDGKVVSFIIEDKIDSLPGEGQLKKYLKSVIKDTFVLTQLDMWCAKEEKDLIKPVYFKTGYVFSDERDAVEQDKYSVFKAEDMKKFLAGHQDAIRENQILCQYSEYLNKKIKSRDEALKNWKFEKDYVQWEFMLKLRQVLRNADDKWQDFVPNELSGEPELGEPDESGQRWKNGLGRGNHPKDPGSWTQYWFSEHLFWQFDWFPERKTPILRPQLRLRIDRKKVGTSNDEIQEYKNLFGQALKQEGLRTGNVGGDIIGSVEIANETAKFQERTVSEFLDRVTRVHIRFLESISTYRRRQMHAQLSPYMRHMDRG